MPAADVAVKLAQVLGVSVEYLVLGVEPGHASKISNAKIPDDEMTRHLISICKKLSERDKKILMSLAEKMASV